MEGLSERSSNIDKFMVLFTLLKIQGGAHALNTDNSWSTVLQFSNFLEARARAQITATPLHKCISLISGYKSAIRQIITIPYMQKTI